MTLEVTKLHLVAEERELSRPKGWAGSGRGDEQCVRHNGTASFFDCTREIGVVGTKWMDGD